MREVDTYSRGIVADRNRLYWEAFKQIALPWPPRAEQDAIVRYLDAADRRIRRYVRAKQRLIALLEEQKRLIVHRAVTRGLNPDVPLKPSGVDWLGDVPAHWKVKRLKWVARLQRGYDLPQEQRVPGPHPVVSSGGVIDQHAEARVRSPGVVLGRYGSTDAVYYIESDFWPHNTALFVTDFHGNDPRWCFHMLRTISKADHAGKSAVPGVDRKNLCEIVIGEPPVAEQQAIVADIERATTEVTGAIARARRQITLMAEYRSRVVADVVTGKLDVRAAAARLADGIDGLDVESFDEVSLDEESAENVPDLEPAEA